MRKAVPVLLLLAALTGCAVSPAPAEPEAPARVLAQGQVAGYMSEQWRALHTALAFQEAQGEVEVLGMSGSTLLLMISTDMAFEIAGAGLRPEGRRVLCDVAEVLREHPASVVHVIAYTDNAGNAQFNQRLSYERARTAVDYLADFRVDRGRLWAAGRGERLPVASNETRLGRARNRRLEIVIRPLVEGRKSKAYRLPPALRVKP